MTVSTPVRERIPYISKKSIAMIKTLYKKDETTGSLHKDYVINRYCCAGYNQAINDICFLLEVPSL